MKLLPGTIFLLFCLLFVGCQQGRGERCQTDSDCSSGYLCCKPAGASAYTSGKCLPINECEEADASVDVEEDVVEEPKTEEPSGDKVSEEVSGAMEDFVEFAEEVNVDELKPVEAAEAEVEIEDVVDVGEL